jgi:hypothetical protein
MRFSVDTGPSCSGVHRYRCAIDRHDSAVGSISVYETARIEGKKSGGHHEFGELLAGAAQGQRSVVAYFEIGSEGALVGSVFDPLALGATRISEGSVGIHETACGHCLHAGVPLGVAP